MQNLFVCKFRCEIKKKKYVELLCKNHFPCNFIYYLSRKIAEFLQNAKIYRIGSDESRTRQSVNVNFFTFFTSYEKREYELRLRRFLIDLHLEM